MANEGCKYCCEGLPEPLFNKEDLIDICAGNERLSVLGVDMSLYFDDEENTTFIALVHDGILGDCVSFEKIKIQSCPMCGRKL